MLGYSGSGTVGEGVAARVIVTVAEGVSGGAGVRLGAIIGAALGTAGAGAAGAQAAESAPRSKHAVHAAFRGNNFSLPPLKFGNAS
jgi:hypothetical protein